MVLIRLRNLVWKDMTDVEPQIHDFKEILKILKNDDAVMPEKLVVNMPLK